mgnify:FL=1
MPSRLRGLRSHQTSEVLKTGVSEKTKIMLDNDRLNTKSFNNCVVPTGLTPHTPTVCYHNFVPLGLGKVP